MSSPAEVIVAFQPVGRRVAASREMTLLAAARAVGVDLESVCGGTGSCGTCRVRLAAGRLSALQAAELDQLTAEERAAGLRLACQVYPLSDVQIDIPPDSLSTLQRLQLETEELPPGSAAAERPIGSAWTSPLGLALDVGTTKLAAYLVDFRSGRTLGAAGAMNPQIAYGEDVISRIAYADRDIEGGRVLQARLIETLNRLTLDLCARIHAAPSQIVEAVAVGNTAMHHLLAGLPVHSLGIAPYRPAVSHALVLPARELGLGLGPEAVVYLPPNVGGFVGADHVAMLLAAGIDRERRTVLAIDIGTNTELSLARDGRVLSCSCASGPAFEGAHISAGMRAAPGAIERVRIAADRVMTQTIGGVPPVGICGSGILDAVAELRSAGVLDRRGSLQRTRPEVRVRDGGLEFLLVPAGDTGHGSDIAVTRHDIRELQLAKAAIRAGIEILLVIAGTDCRALDEIVVAGAFGTYLDLRSAVTIGMFPGLPLGRFRQIGNAAGLGARLLLRSAERRREAEALVGRIEYVELSGDPAFSERFLQELGFTPA